MPRFEHPNFTAAKMAATEMNDLMARIKDSEYGHFPVAEPTSRTQKRHEALANAPEDIRALLDNGYPMHFVERLARVAGEDK